MEQKLLPTQDACKLVGLTPKNFALRANRLGIIAAKEERKPNGGKPQKFWTLEQTNQIGKNSRADVIETYETHTETEPTPDNEPESDSVSLPATEPVDNSEPPVVAEPAPVVEAVVTLADRANRIRTLQADVQRGIIQIGEELIAAKEEVGHGNWSAWLDKEFSWTQRTANNFMRVAERFGKMENVFQFQPSALQAMLALPEGTEQEFIDAQADQGTPVETQSARDVQKNVKAFKTSRANTKQPTKETAEEPTPATNDEHDTDSENSPAADPLPTQMDAPKMDNVAHFQPFLLQGNVARIVTPEKIIALRELVTETDDLHALKTIHDSLLALEKEIGKIVLLAEMKIGELAQKN